MLLFSDIVYNERKENKSNLITIAKYKTLERIPLDLDGLCTHPITTVICTIS